MRSAYDPSLWSRAASQARLDVTRHVTARSLGSQTTDDFTVALLLDPDDPLCASREEVWRAAVGKERLRPLYWKSVIGDFAPWDTRRTREQPTGSLAMKNRVAAMAYRYAWSDALQLVSGATLMTRLDDDDALARDTLQRVRRAVNPRLGRHALIHPNGFRVWRGQYDRVVHRVNAMHSLYAPDGDDICIYDYGHTKVRQKISRIVEPDRRAAWLWVRHPDTISGWRKSTRPVNAQLRRLFDVEWGFLEALR